MFNIYKTCYTPKTNIVFTHSELGSNPEGLAGQFFQKHTREKTDQANKKRT